MNKEIYKQNITALRNKYPAWANIIKNTHKKKNIPYRSDRYGDDFNWDSLYANYKEISATSNV